MIHPNSVASPNGMRNILLLSGESGALVGPTILSTSKSIWIPSTPVRPLWIHLSTCVRTDRITSSFSCGDKEQVAYTTTPSSRTVRRACRTSAI